MSHYHFCEKLGITENEIQKRSQFIGLSEADVPHLQEIRNIFHAHEDNIIEEFYNYLAQFAELSRFISDAATLQRIKGTQRTYLATLGQAWTSLDYCENRLTIGCTHERISLPPKWFVGAYGKLFELLSRHITEHYRHNPQRVPPLLTTLGKIFTFDQHLSLEAYYKVITERTDSLLNDLSEAQHRLEDTIRIDPLTQVLNRKYLLETLEMEFHRSKRFHRPFTVLFLDMDHFKKINDEYGHAFGDLVLETVGRKLPKLVRPSDVVGRYGGEEFVIGLVECPADRAGVIAERLRAEIGMTTITHDGHMLHATVSIGFSSVEPETASLDELLKKADKALYQSKALGRNQVAFMM